MASLLQKVHRKMSLVAIRRVASALDGEHASVFKGRSIDFDDLRAYIVGDDVKDIDWKATARSNQVLIKRYIAIRKNNIMLVVDTGRSMAATAPSGESKRDIAIMTSGIIASVAQQHGDLIAMTAGDSERIKYMPLKGSRAHIERMLQHINNNITLDSPESNLVHVLDYIRRTVKRRMMLIIISDNLQFVPAQEQLLRRLSAQHELLFIAIDDLDPNTNDWQDKDVYDVNRPTKLPQFIRSQKNIETAYTQLVQQQWGETYHTLQRLSISNVRIDKEDSAVGQIVRLLEEHKHVKH